MSVSKATANLSGAFKSKASYRIGVVTARFNANVTEKLEAGALSYLNKMGFTDERVLKVSVPGAFEIPLAAKGMLESGCDAIIALGAVIRGDTDHYDYVCKAVTDGCLQVQILLGRPISFGVLTTNNEAQALDRAGGSLGNKGEEAAMVVLEMLDLIHSLKESRTKVPSP